MSLICHQLICVTTKIYVTNQRSLLKKCTAKFNPLIVGKVTFMRFYKEIFPLTCTLYKPLIFANQHCLTNQYCLLNSTEPNEVFQIRLGFPCLSTLCMYVLYVCLSGSFRSQFLSYRPEIRYTSS